MQGRVLPWIPHGTPSPNLRSLPASTDPVLPDSRRRVSSLRLLPRRDATRRARQDPRFPARRPRDRQSTPRRPRAARSPHGRPPAPACAMERHVCHADGRLQGRRDDADPGRRRRVRQGAGARRAQTELWSHPRRSRGRRARRGRGFHGAMADGPRARRLRRRTDARQGADGRRGTAGPGRQRPGRRRARGSRRYVRRSPARGRGDCPRDDDDDRVRHDSPRVQPEARDAAQSACDGARGGWVVDRIRRRRGHGRRSLCRGWRWRRIPSAFRLASAASSASNRRGDE